MPKPTIRVKSFLNVIFNKFAENSQQKVGTLVNIASMILGTLSTSGNSAQEISRIGAQSRNYIFPRKPKEAHRGEVQVSFIQQLGIIQVVFKPQSLKKITGGLFSFTEKLSYIKRLYLFFRRIPSPILEKLVLFFFFFTLKKI